MTPKTSINTSIINLHNTKPKKVVKTPTPAKHAMPAFQFQNWYTSEE